MAWKRSAALIAVTCAIGMVAGVGAAAAGRLFQLSWSLPAWEGTQYDGVAATTDVADLTTLPSVRRSRHRRTLRRLPTEREPRLLSRRPCNEHQA